MLEYRPGTVYAGFPSSYVFVVGGQAHFNFLAATLVPIATIRTITRAIPKKLI